MDTRKKLLIIGGALALVLVSFFVLEITNVTHLFHKDKQPHFVATPNKGGASVDNQKGEQNASTSSSTSPATQPGDNKNTVAGDTVLSTPEGTFVSNHYPGRNGSPLTESSVCNTTPGATCQITFTLGSTVKTLPAQVTDRGGSTYWNNWTPASIGLTAGEWKVQAVSSLNGQTKSAADAMNLTVGS